MRKRSGRTSPRRHPRKWVEGRRRRVVPTSLHTNKAPPASRPPCPPPRPRHDSWLEDRAAAQPREGRKEKTPSVGPFARGRGASAGERRGGDGMWFWGNKRCHNPPDGWLEGRSEARPRGGSAGLGQGGGGASGGRPHVTRRGGAARGRAASRLPAAAKMAELDLLGAILSSMEPPPSMGDREARRAREQTAQLKKLQEQDKRQKVEFRKRMEKEVSGFIQDSSQAKKKFQPMNKIERSILHDVVDVAGLTSFSFGDDEDSRYVMVFKKEFAPSDEELETYRRGEEWDPQQAQEKRRLKELAQKQAEEEALRGPTVVHPNTDYKDKYSHLIGKTAAKDAAHTMEANKSYGCVPVANKRDTRSIEEAMNEIRAKKRLRQMEGESPVLPAKSS